MASLVYAPRAAPERTADLDAALERLLRSQIIVRTSRESGEVYAFKHALIQGIAYESLLRRRRRSSPAITSWAQIPRARSSGSTGPRPRPRFDPRSRRSPHIAPTR